MAERDDARVAMWTTISGAMARAHLLDDAPVGELILVRHGQQLGTRERGDDERDRRDPPLTELGHRQAEAMATHLATESVTAVYASTYRRAQQTAQPLGERLGHDVVTWPEIHEIEMFRDLTRNPDVTDIAESVDLRSVEGGAAAFERDRTWASFPHGEQGPAFTQRVVRGVEGILARHVDQRIAVVCHGGVINAYVGWALGVDTDMWFRPYHASIHRLRFRDGRRVVERLNESHHLVGELLTF